jgi:hypothetical protein
MMSRSLSDLLAEGLEAIGRGEMTPADFMDRYPEHRDELEGLLAVADTLRAAPTASPRPEFRRVARTRLLNLLAERSKNPRAIKRKRKPWFVRLVRTPIVARSLVAVALVMVILSLTFGGVAYAWSSALPGDELYPLKTAAERARLATKEGEDEVSLHLKFAQSRVREIESLAEQERYEDVAVAVDGFETHVAEGTRGLVVMATRHAIRVGDLIAADQVLSETGGALAELLPAVPESARAGVEHAVILSTEYRDLLANSFPSYVRLSNRNPLPELTKSP